MKTYYKRNFSLFSFIHEQEINFLWRSASDHFVRGKLH